MPDADDDRDRQQRVAVALAELAVVDEVQPDRPGHDREREDRVGEVVQRPRGRDDRPAARGQPGEPSGAGDAGSLDRSGAAALVTRAMIAGARTGRMCRWHRNRAARRPPREPSSRRCGRRSSARSSPNDVDDPIVEPLWVGVRVPRPPSTPTAPSIVDEDGDHGRGLRRDRRVAGRGRPGDRPRPRRLPDQAGRPRRPVAVRRLVGRDADRWARSSGSGATRGRHAQAARGRAGGPLVRRSTTRSASSRPTCSGSTTRSLLDVPLLERRRILESVARRVGPRPDRGVHPAADQRGSARGRPRASPA